MATLEDLEGPRCGTRSVPRLSTELCVTDSLLAAVKALGKDQRQHALGLAAVKTELAEFRQETRSTSGSVDQQLAELKDLIIGRRNGQ